MNGVFGVLFEFVAKAQYGVVRCATVYVSIVSPNVLQKVFGGYDLHRSFGEIAQQIELFGCELDGRAISVQHTIGETQLAGL